MPSPPKLRRQKTQRQSKIVEIVDVDEERSSGKGDPFGTPQSGTLRYGLDGGKDKVVASFDMVFAMLKVMHDDLESLKKETVATSRWNRALGPQMGQGGRNVIPFAPVCLHWWQVLLTCSWIFLETLLALFGMPYKGVRISL